MIQRADTLNHFGFIVWRKRRKNYHRHKFNLMYKTIQYFIFLKICLYYVNSIVLKTNTNKENIE